MLVVTGFSKLNKSERIDILRKHVPLNEEQVHSLSTFQGNDIKINDLIENLSENHVSNYVLPFGIAPNFLINDRFYFVPMVTEESSVVAAAAYAAKFWSDKGGFKARVLGTKKIGQIYFSWKGDIKWLQDDLPILKEKLLSRAKPLTSNMDKRGAGHNRYIFKSR